MDLQLKMKDTLLLTAQTVFHKFTQTAPTDPTSQSRHLTHLNE